MSQGARWRDSLNSPQADPVERELVEARSEKLATLQDMLAGTAWQETCVPALRKHMQRIATKLAVDKRSDLPQIRAEQAKYELLRWLLDNPSTFFGGGAEETK